MVKPHISNLSVLIGSSSSPPGNTFSVGNPNMRGISPNYSTHAMVTHSAIFLSGLKTSCDVCILHWPEWTFENRQTPGKLGTVYPICKLCHMAVEHFRKKWTQYQHYTIPKGHHPEITPSFPSWWFQPIWKILVKMDHSPKIGGEHKQYIWSTNQFLMLFFQVTCNNILGCEEPLPSNRKAARRLVIDDSYKLTRVKCC